MNPREVVYPKNRKQHSSFTLSSKIISETGQTKDCTSCKNVRKTSKDPDSVEINYFRHSLLKSIKSHIFQTIHNRIIPPKRLTEMIEQPHFYLSDQICRLFPGQRAVFSVKFFAVGGF